MLLLLIGGNVQDAAAAMTLHAMMLVVSCMRRSRGFDLVWIGLTLDVNNRPCV